MRVVRFGAGAIVVILTVRLMSQTYVIDLSVPS